MFIADAPLDQNNQSAIFASRSPIKSDSKYWRVLGGCQLISNNTTEVEEQGGALNPSKTALIYFFNKEPHQKFTSKTEGKIISFTPPKSGELKDLGDGQYRYVPKPGFFGTDSLTFVLDFSGKKVKFIYTFKPINGNLGGEETYRRACGNNGELRRIGFDRYAADLKLAVNYSTSETWLRSALLSALLATDLDQTKGESTNTVR